MGKYEMSSVDIDTQPAEQVRRPNAQVETWHLKPALQQKDSSMASRKPLIQPHWVRYALTDLIRRWLDAKAAYDAEYDRLLALSRVRPPSELHREASSYSAIEMPAALLKLALQLTGPVRMNEQVYRTDGHYILTAAADDDHAATDAEGLYVEIVSPLNGNARLCR